MFGPPFLTDIARSFGFPFKLYVSGGFIGEYIVWGGLIADILIAACGSVLLGWLAEVVFRKYAGRQMN